MIEVAVFELGAGTVFDCGMRLVKGVAGRIALAGPGTASRVRRACLASADLSKNMIFVGPAAAVVEERRMVRVVVRCQNSSSLLRSRHWP